MTGTVLAGLASALILTQARAQTPNWVAPANGYLYDRLTESIRPVVGFGGSAYLGSPVVSGVAWASLAPNQQTALAVVNAALVSIANLGAPGQFQTIDQSDLPKQALWSSDSTRAVVLTETGQLKWLTNLSSTPSQEAGWDLDPARRAGPGLPRWSLLAADSAADGVLVTSRFGDTWKLWWASEAASPVWIPTVGHPVSAVFTSGNAAFVADAAGHRIMQIRNLDGVPAATQLLFSDRYISDPVGLALSAAGNLLYVADGSDQTVRSFDTGTGALVGALPFSSSATSLTSVSAGRYALNASGTAGPLYFLDTGSAPRVFFIPRGEQ
jgi:hypothetical protein